MTGDDLKDKILLYHQLDWQYKISDYTDQSLKLIQKSLNKARNELFEEIGHRDFRIPAGREDELYGYLTGMSEAIGVQLSDDIVQSSTVAGVNSVSEYNDILSFQGQVVGFNSVAVSPAQMQAIVMQAEFGGHVLNDWIDRTTGLIFDDEMKADLMAGYFRGEGARKLVTRLTDNYDVFEHNAISLVRTYTSGANNEAAKIVYNQNKDIVDTEEWSATLEVSMKGHSTCLRCAVMDGTRFKIDSAHVRPPLHLRCRCFMVPITKSYKELGLNIPEMKNTLRPYTERQAGTSIDAGLTRTIEKVGQFSGDFEPFLKSRSKAYQMDLLGPGRYGLLEKGKIKWQDLVDKNGNLRLLKKNKEGVVTGLKQ